jgi:hypothetical protein
MEAIVPCYVENLSSQISGLKFQIKVTAASKRRDTNVLPVAILLLRRFPNRSRIGPS